MKRENTALRRKEMKEKSRKIVRKHYFVLAFLILILVLFGTEYSGLLSSWQLTSTGREGLPVRINPNNRFSDLSAIEPKEILNMVLGNTALTDNPLVALLSQKARTGEESAALGRTNGVLAQIVNTISSGKLSTQVIKSITSITRSDRMTSVVLIIGALVWFALIYIFLKEVYSAVMRRVFLEARVYEKVSVFDVTYFLQVKKWLHASWVMLVQRIFLFLWSLTVVGGVIKYFSYWAVPYIVAENPAAPAKEVVTLSRKMMDGHKLELFKFQLSMIGWNLLGILTFGISELVYGLAYRHACYCEFYAQIRENALSSGMEGSAILNDRYLFEVADRILLYENYFDIVDEITLIHEGRVELGKMQKFLADFFGIWIGPVHVKKAYDEQEGRKYAIRQYKMAMLGEAYPYRLNALYNEKSTPQKTHFSPLRSYPVWVLFLLFIAFCFAGWSWEVALHLIQTGKFANRGTMYGPWLPIYGTGGVLVLILCSRFRKNPVQEFFTAVLLCGTLEYLSGWYLETRFHQRWWSYDGYFLNLHGRICAEGLLVFGVGCCVVVYLIAPIFDYVLSMAKTSVLIGITVVLAVVFNTDMVYSSSHPNMVEGAIEAEDAPPARADEFMSETESAMP